MGRGLPPAARRAESAGTRPAVITSLASAQGPLLSNSVCGPAHPFTSGDGDRGGRQDSGDSGEEGVIGSENTPSPHVWPEKLLSRRQELFYHPVVLLLGGPDQAGLGPHPAPDQRTEGRLVSTDRPGDQTLETAVGKRASVSRGSRTKGTVWAVRDRSCEASSPAWIQEPRAASWDGSGAESG